MTWRGPQIFISSKWEVLGGGPIRRPRVPPRGFDLGSDLESISGPRSSSIWNASGVPFGAPKEDPCSGSEKLPKPDIYNAFGYFRTLEKGLELSPREGPDLASRGPPKVSEKEVLNYRKRCNYSTFAISGGLFWGRFWGPFRGHVGGRFWEPFRSSI